MIIPPDPEKDPNLFNQSTSSLVSSEDDGAYADVPLPPDAVYHPASAPNVLASYHPYGAYEEDFGPWDSNEVLPPYEGKRKSRESHALAAETESIRGSASRSRSSRVLARPVSHVGSLAAESSSSHLPRDEFLTLPGPSTQRGTYPPLSPSVDGFASSTTAGTPATASIASAKRWGGLFSRRRRRRGFFGIRLPARARIPLSPEAQKFIREHRKGITIGAVIAGTLLLLMIGLIVGFTLAFVAKRNGKASPSWYNKGNHQSNVGAEPDLTLKYDPTRDGPKPGDGTAENCNEFEPLNVSSAVSQLALSSTRFDHYSTTFTFPLDTSSRIASLHDQLYFIARGLATSGTIEFVGTRSSSPVVSGGQEGIIQVDVIARMARGQNLTSIVNVCQMTRDDGSTGVGIYTPTQTVGKVKQPNILDPLLTPVFHVVVRLPPSVLTSLTPVALANVSLSLDQMTTRFGYLPMVEFGSLTVDAQSTYGGAVVSDLVVADKMSIYGAEGTVQGVFNISSSLFINATAGTISAAVYLRDPDLPEDNSTSVEGARLVTRDAPGLSEAIHERGLPEAIRERVPGLGSGPGLGGFGPLQYHTPLPSANSSEIAKAAAALPEPTRRISTEFNTQAGFVFVSYMHHPPTVALNSYVSSRSGMVDISMHPNFVGGFALQNLWGNVRSSTAPQSAVQLTDPAGLGRIRTVTMGSIDDDSNPFFRKHGINDDDNNLSVVTSTGAAYWTASGTSMTPQDVQKSPEGKSALIAEAQLGDLQVTFDGT